MHFVGTDFQLNVTPGTEVDTLPFRNFEYQLFDERGNVMVGNNFTFPLFDAEELGSHFDLHILLYRHLARQPPMIFGLTHREVTGLGGQHCPAAVHDLTLTLGAGTAASAG